MSRTNVPTLCCDIALVLQVELRRRSCLSSLKGAHLDCRPSALEKLHGVDSFQVTFPNGQVFEVAVREVTGE